MSEAEFILERLALYPASAVAKMAGCSVQTVKAIKAYSAAPPLPLRLPPRFRAPEAIGEWRPSLPPAARKAVLAIAAKHGLSLAMIMGPGVGYAPLSRARQEAYWALRQVRGAAGEALYSFPRIGDWFSGRDHATVMWGVKRYEARMAGLEHRRPKAESY